MKIVMDMETRSTVDLIAAGAHVYAEHPTTDILLISIKVGGSNPYLVSTMPPNPISGNAYRMLQDVKRAEEIHAHNVQFERIMWTEIMHKRFGLDEIPFEKWRDTAAKAAAYALPRDLGRACLALGLTVKKDMEGRRLMLRMCKPRKPTKDQDQNAILWHETPDQIKRLGAYCNQDVEAEYALDQALIDLPQSELDIWRLDQKINDRGIYADRDEIQNIITKIETYNEKALAEVVEITKGKITSVRQVEKTRLWLAAQSVFMPDMTKQTVIETLKGDLPPKAKRILELRQALSMSSVAKFNAMKIRQTKGQGRMKGTMLYHGASTGRFSGKGVQPHNFPRVCFNEQEYDAYLASTVKDFEESNWSLLAGASAALRGTLRSAPGNRLLCGDFSAIEAKILAWVAGEQWVLDAFNEGKDIYKVTAGTIYHEKYETVTPDMRNVGKVADLALGYQGWLGAFVMFAEVYGVSFPEELRESLSAKVYNKAKSRIDHPDQFTTAEVKAAWLVVDAGATEEDLFEAWAVPIMADWRESHKATTAFWRGVEEAAILAIKTGKTYQYRGVKFGMRGKFLHCRLPNGRLLSYYDPKVKYHKDRYGRFKDHISFMGMNAYTNQWERMGTWGGKLTENIVQALARDFLTDAMIRLEKKGYAIVFHVHDEIIAEVRDPNKTLNEFLNLMAVKPEWAKDCPTSAAGWEGIRYRKD